MENEGGKFFEPLVQEGEELEARLQQSINDQFAEVKDRASDLWGRTEQMLEAPVTHTLKQLNMSTDEDVKALAKRVDKLSESIKSLGKPSQLTKATSSSRQDAGKRGVTRRVKACIINIPKASKKTRMPRCR